MAIKLIASEYCGYVDDYRREYVVDSDDDFINLPDSGVGSIAVSPSGAVQMVNASGEWVDFGG